MLRVLGVPHEKPMFEILKIKMGNKPINVSPEAKPFAPACSSQHCADKLANTQLSDTSLLNTFPIHRRCTKISKLCDIFELGKHRTTQFFIEKRMCRFLRENVICDELQRLKKYTPIRKVNSKKTSRMFLCFMVLKTVTKIRVEEIHEFWASVANAKKKKIWFFISVLSIQLNAAATAIGQVCLMLWKL